MGLSAQADQVPTKVRNYVLKTCDQYSSATLREKAREYQQVIQAAATQYGVSEELIKAVITAETCFRPKAISPKGAAGLMQLMPDTARRFGATDESITHNIHAGARYLRWLLDRYDGSVQHAVAAYNSGEGTVDRHGLAVPYQETQLYMARVMNAYRKLGGEPDEAIQDTDQPVTIVQRAVSRAVGKKPQQQRLIERRLTGNRAETRLLPSCMTASRKLHRATDHKDRRGERAFYYTVRKNDSLDKIMRLTGISPIAIKRFNNLKGSRIKPGQELKISECRL